jgi:branched-chain amino acid transport system permease protein
LRAVSVPIVLTALLLVAPLGLGDYRAYQLALYFLYAAAATGVGLCWGRAGFLPLGQAMFFGIAAYLAGLALIAFPDGVAPFLLLPLCAAAAGLLAYGIGVLVFRSQGESGPYFSMITLALALLAFQIATNWNAVTGGFNGLKGIPGLPGLDDFSASYYVSTTVLLAVLALSAWLISSPIGVLWKALATSERRLALFGFDTNQLKAVAFGISGLFAGLGGAVYAPQQGLVTPQTAGFSLSADFVIWAAVGGRFDLLGPALGTLIVGTLTAELRDRVPFWEALMAAFFILVVLALPRGLIGPPAGLARRLLRPRPDKPGLIAPAQKLPAGAARLRIADVSARLGEVTILDRLSLVIDEPGIFCIIGPNGAGKTSTFNLLTGELSPGRGAVLLDDEDVTRLAPHRVIRRGISRKFQIPTVFTELTVRENLCIALWSGRASALDLLRPRLRHWTTPMLDELATRYPFLAEGSRRAAELSHGERQLLELAMALLTEPRLLLLDEPCAGLSPEETATVIDVIRWAQARLGAAIVVIEHDMSLVKELARAVYVLHNGTLLAQGSVAEVRENAAVRAVYVGADKHVGADK